MSKTNLTIAVPAKHSVDTVFVQSLLQAISLVSKVFNVKLDFLPGKSNIIHARSIMLSRWYSNSNDDDLFLFIDSDHVFSGYDILKLHSVTDADIKCGIYCSAAGNANCFPMNPKDFDFDKRVLYAGTGFMLINRPICTKIIDKIVELDGTKCVNIDPDNQYAIPFFKTRIIKSELNPHQVEQDWLGEDYSFCWMARQVGGVIKAEAVEGMGHNVSKVVYFRDDPKYIGEQRRKMERQTQKNKAHSKKWERESATKRNIVYYCGRSGLKFGPNVSSMGGSEKATVNLSRELVKLGHSVTVFGNVEEGIYDGVLYMNYNKFNPMDEFDVIILWRGFAFGELQNIKYANKIMLDFHDNSNLSQYPDDFFDKVDAIMLKSNYHKKLFPKFNDKNVVICKNGLEDIFRQENLKQFSNVKRERLKFCYTSSYVRELDLILTYIWPGIHSRFPEAELHLFYGMQLVEPSQKKRLEKMIEESPNTYDNGRIPIEELIKIKFKFPFHLYVTKTNAEIDCLSVRESAQCGCIPIISNEAVFSERQGFHLSGDMKSVDFYENAVDSIIKFVSNKDKIKKTAKKIRNKKEMFWDDVAKVWENTFNS